MDPLGGRDGREAEPTQGEGWGEAPGWNHSGGGVGRSSRLDPLRGRGGEKLQIGPLTTDLV